MSRAKPNRPKECVYVGKGGLKLEFALKHFGYNPEGQSAADLGSHQGGFVDCLLHHNVEKVYSVDTCYGLLDWKLRNDNRVQVFERKNALHWIAPEKLSIITIDVGWTKQSLIIPAAVKNLKENGVIFSLLKPQYECSKDKLKRGVLDKEQIQEIIDNLYTFFQETFSEVSFTYSPYIGSGGNTEAWFFLKK